MMIYDVLHDGWDNAPDLFNTGTDQTFDEELAALGFQQFLTLGEDFSAVELIVYRRNGFPGTEFLVNPCFNASECCLFLVANVGSLIDLFTKLGPMLLAGCTSELMHEVMDLIELVKEDGGPLQSAVMHRYRKESQQRVERRRKNAEAQKAESA